MTRPTTPVGITKASLVLGSAVAIAGLVATMPAHAATSCSGCSSKSMTKKSSAKTGTLAKKTMKSSKCGACSGK